MKPNGSIDELTIPLDSNRFLKDYWQKRPAIIRSMYTPWVDPISPDELAGLATEDDVSSRMVTQLGDNQWSVDHGPFTESDFSNLAESSWTLLVQEVDQLKSEVYELWDMVGFLPKWRIDDIMVSYAADQGSVGPHTDSYDVFLIQGRGARKWHLSASPIREPTLISGLELKVMKDFDPEVEVALECGDSLYVPPHYAHHGIAVGEAMTYSLGFKSPSITDVIRHSADLAAIYEPRANEPMSASILDMELRGTGLGACPNIADELIGLMTPVFQNKDLLAKAYACAATASRTARTDITQHDFFSNSKENQDRVLELLEENKGMLFRNPRIPALLVETTVGPALAIDGWIQKITIAESKLMAHILSRRPFQRFALQQPREAKSLLNLVSNLVAVDFLYF